MSSQRRIAASRANGALSRGPKTPETRQASAANSLSHGLTAKTVVLATESQDSFQQLLDAYMLRFQPRDRVETDLIEEMAVAKWRQRRLWAIETGCFNVEMSSPARTWEQQDPRFRGPFVEAEDSARQATAFKHLADRSNTLDLINRYESRLRNTSERALAGFEYLHARRNEPSPVIEHQSRDQELLQDSAAAD